MLKVAIFRFIVKLMPLIYWGKKVPQHLHARDETIAVEGGSIRIRIYVPAGKGPFPVTLYFHGGGFVLGNLDSCDPMCRELCTAAGHIVVSVEYRLAPEFPFPTAVMDCLEALDWLASRGDTLNCDMNNVFVAGDSAGGNLATVVAREARQAHPGLIRGQVLLYPVTHHYSIDTPSYLQHVKTRSLNRGMMVWFWDTYYKNSPMIRPGKFTHELATPLALDDLENMPPALLIMADDDPLRDEGVMYADKLQAQGNDVQKSVYPGVEHGFIGYMGPTPEHKKGLAEIVDWLKRHTR